MCIYVVIVISLYLYKLDLTSINNNHKKWIKVIPYQLGRNWEL